MGGGFLPGQQRSAAPRLLRKMSPGPIYSENLKFVQREGAGTIRPFNTVAPDGLGASVPTSRVTVTVKASCGGSGIGTVALPSESGMNSAAKVSRLRFSSHHTRKTVPFAAAFIPAT